MEANRKTHKTAKRWKGSLIVKEKDRGRFGHVFVHLGRTPVDREQDCKKERIVDKAP